MSALPESDRHDPMTIALVTDSHFPSGVGSHMLALAEVLGARHPVTVMFRDDPAGAVFARRGGSRGIDVSLIDFEADDSFMCALRAHRVAILHVHAGIGWESHALTHAGRVLGLTVVRTEHLPWLITDEGQRADYIAALGDVDAVITVSGDSYRSFAAAYEAFEKPAPLLTLVRNGVPRPEGSLSRASARTVLGLNDDEFLFLSVARFTPQKDHRTLIEAWSRVVSGGRRARLALVGTGETLPETIQAASGLEGIGFLGEREDVADLLVACDAFVLSSRFEGLPLVVLEAMAAHTCVVATRIGGVIEALGENHPFLSDAGSPVSLADAMLAVLADPEHARTVAREQYRRFQNSFSAARMTQETEHVYRTARLA